MRMIKFAGLFPEVAARQAVMLWVDPPRKQLPVKAYWLLEYYCDVPGCDCRRVVLDARSSDQPDRIFASIHFGWERPEFYREWAADLWSARAITRGTLDPSDFNCDWADVLVKHVRKEVLADPKAVARFKRYYQMCKREQRKRMRRSRGTSPDRA